MLPHGHLCVESERVDAPDVDEVGAAEEGHERVDRAELIDGESVQLRVKRDVENRHARGFQSSLDLGDEAAREERVVEDVGEFDVESVVCERVAMDVAVDHEWRRRNEIDSYRVCDTDLLERDDLLSHPRADAHHLVALVYQALV